MRPSKVPTASSKFDRLINSLCLEHQECIRRAQEECQVGQRLTTGSRLSGGDALASQSSVKGGSMFSGDTMAFAPTASLNLNSARLTPHQRAARRVSCLSASEVQTHLIQDNSSYRVADHTSDSLVSTRPSDTTNGIFTGKFAASMESEDGEKSSLSVPNERKDVLHDEEHNFGLRGSDVLQVPYLLATSEMSLAASSNLGSAPTLSTSRGTRLYDKFELRQTWDEQDWGVRQSDYSTHFGNHKTEPFDPEDTMDSTMLDMDGRHGYGYKFILDRFVLHPNSRKRIMWDTMCLFMVFYDIIVVPLQAFSLDDIEALHIVDYILRLIWTLDMPLSCFAGFYFKGRLHMSFRAARRHYFFTWFPLDVVLVGSDWLLYFMTADVSDTSKDVGKIIRFARIARMIRLLRLVKLRGLVQSSEYVIYSENVSIYFRCVKPLFAVVLLTHVLACGWFGVGMWDETYEHNWIFQSRTLERSKGYQYATSLHWSLAQFTLNTMDVSAQNIGERLYTIAVGLFGIIAFSSLVSGFTSAAEQLREIKSDQTKQFWKLRCFMKDHKISKKLTYRVMRYCEYAYLDQKQRVQPMEVTLIKLLSEQLRLELSMEMHLPQLTPHPLFARLQQLGYKSLRIICFHLSPLSFAREDSVVSKGDEAAGMIMLTEGHALYVHTDQTGKFNQRLDPGMWLCEPALWTYWTTVGSAKAQVNSRALVVMADVMEKVFTSAPINEWIYVQRHAQKYVAMLNLLGKEELNDVVDPILPSGGTSLPERDLGNVGGLMKLMNRRLSGRLGFGLMGALPRISGKSTNSGGAKSSGEKSQEEISQCDPKASIESNIPDDKSADLSSDVETNWPGKLRPSAAYDSCSSGTVGLYSPDSQQQTCGKIHL